MSPYREMSSSVNRESWNKHALRYQHDSEFSDSVVDFGDPDFPTDDDVSIIGDVSNLRILELGAGAANCSLALAGKGAKVTCLDISIAQLVAGSESASRLGFENEVTFVVGDGEQLPFIWGTRFDLVVSVSAIEYMCNFQQIITNMYSILVPGGRFIYSEPHPVMCALDASDLSPEDGADPSYFYRGEVTWKWQPEDDFKFITYRHTVGDVVEWFTESGFLVRRLLELGPKRECPQWSQVERDLRLRFPSFLVVEAVHGG